MSESKTWNIKTEDLCVGSSLGFDLLDSHGRVILKAGVPVSERLKLTLTERGITTLSVQGVEEKQDSALLLETYDAVLVQRLQNCISETESLIAEMTESLKSKMPTDLAELQASLDGFLIEAEKDISATIGVIGARTSTNDAEAIRKLSNRATKFSFTSAVVGLTFGLDGEDLIDLGISTILHDISLAQNLNWFVPGYMAKEDPAFWDEYMYHPDLSADWLTHAGGISNQAIRSVLQVHEMLDGTGFPRNIRGSQMGAISRVAAVVDSYIQLTDPLFGEPTYEPADALAYLCKQAANGKFDSETMRSLLRAISIYPIGSKVMLNDGSKALVVRTSASSMMRPVVKRLESETRLMDLSQSEYSVVGPYKDEKSTFTRITKGMLDQILWPHLVQATSS